MFLDDAWVETCCNDTDENRRFTIGREGSGGRRLVHRRHLVADRELRREPKDANRGA